MAKSPTKNPTALILTYNEEENIEMVLDKLRWVDRVIVLDSGSTDSTLTRIDNYPNTEVFYRKFDTHAAQWNFGLTLVETEWVLTLDADYVLTPGFIKEVKEFVREEDLAACFTRFRFVVFGQPLLRNNTTRRPVLFRKSNCTYYDDGHTQRLKINGKTKAFKSYIFHNDRKPLSRWLSNLDRYSVKECAKLLDERDPRYNSFVPRVRRTKILAPFLVFFYCLLLNGAILDGWRGWHYTIQRTIVEFWFALRLIEEEKLKKQPGQSEKLARSTAAFESDTRHHSTVLRN